MGVAGNGAAFLMQRGPNGAKSIFCAVKGPFYQESALFVFRLSLLAVTAVGTT
jgi:hypothetical protein